MPAVCPECWERDEETKSLLAKRYLDPAGNTVTVSQEYSGVSWGAFRTRPLNILTRVRSKFLPLTACRITAARNLELYARHTRGWREIPERERLSSLLSLVMSPFPAKEDMYRWSHKALVEAAEWASALHLRASDNAVRVPKEPEVITIWRRDHGQVM